MRISVLAVSTVGVAVLCTSAASAYEFRCRWVERVGTVDTVIGGDGASVNFLDGQAHRLRIQFGVFDDAAGAAPVGGFIGWNNGVLDAGTSASYPDARRTPGRIAPFNFSIQPFANGNPPLPGGDPFRHLINIDATGGVQNHVWRCGTDGNPLPMPEATILGRNSYESVFEITLQNGPRTGAAYDIAASGNLIGVNEWRAAFPSPPDCVEGFDGQVAYLPLTTTPRAFQCRLHVVVPGPGSALGVALLGLIGIRRRRW